MNGSAPRSLRDENVLGLLRTLCWTVTRFHQSSRGGRIVTALRNGRIASAELPEPRAEESLSVWLSRLDAALSLNAYDPVDSEPPLLVRPVSDDTVELVPLRCRLARRPGTPTRGPNPTSCSDRSRRISAR